MTKFPKTQFVLVLFINGKPFAETIDNTGNTPMVYNRYNYVWNELSDEEISYYESKASRIITSED